LEAFYSFVRKIIGAFEGAGLDYAFTGALATSFYGVPRTTSDVDVILTVGLDTCLKSKLLKALQTAHLTVDERKIDSALTSGFRIATFKDTASPYCIDIIFSNEKPDKKPGKIAGLDTFFLSPEGLIAAKLRMIKSTVSPQTQAKDKKDIEGILKFTKVDLNTVKKQAKKDGTLQVFDALGLKA
jgi:hypothetical protein